MPQNSSDPYLDAAVIRASTFIRHVEIHDTLDSTNNRAAELAGDRNIELPALIAARHQTAGRGRGSNVWHSADGALTFSILLDPSALGINTANWPQLSLATAVAVCDAVCSELNESNQRAEASPSLIELADEPARANPQSPHLGIKWPNDVMLNDRKVCGILIESRGGAAAKKCLIIGIGINVNNSGFDAPLQMNSCGITVRDVTGAHHDLTSVLIGVLQTLRSRLDQLATNHHQLARTFQRLCWLTGQSVVVQTGVQATHGDCVGIDCDGALRIRNGDGTHRIFSGSVRLKSTTEHG